MLIKEIAYSKSSFTYLKKVSLKQRGILKIYLVTVFFSQVSKNKLKFTFQSFLRKMNALKILKTGMRPVVTRKFSMKPFLNRQLMRQPNFDDSFFGMASSVMRNLEREFDFMNRQFNKNLQLSSPVKSIFDVDNMMQNCIQIDDKGDRNFSLRLNVVGFDPEEIQVNTEGQNLQIQAKSEKSVKFIFVNKLKILNQFI
jgi:HSP20 family molecular chaperone IbpA